MSSDSPDLSSLIASLLETEVEETTHVIKLENYHTPTSLELRLPEGNIIIHGDGRVELSKNLDIDSASRMFWEKISFYGSPEANQAWQESNRCLKEELDIRNSMIEDLKKELEKTREKIKELTFKGTIELVDKFDLEE